jgi:hypothetical protein
LRLERIERLRHAQKDITDSNVSLFSVMPRYWVDSYKVPRGVRSRGKFLSILTTVKGRRNDL